MGIFIIQNSFIVFLSILQHDFYTFACAQKPLVEALFPLRLRHRQNMIRSGDENRCPCIFSWYAGIKRSHWMQSQGCTADEPSIRHFSRSKRRWFEPMCESSHSLGGQWCVFSGSFFEFRRRLQANKLWCTTHNWPSYDVQLEQSPHDQFCWRNRRLPASKCFFHKHLSLDLSLKAHMVYCCFVSGSYA